MSLRLKILLPLVSLATILLVYLYGYWMPRSLANIEAGYLRSIERHLDSVAEGLVPLLLGHQLDTIYENLDSLMKKNRDWVSIRLVAADGRPLYPLETSPPAAADSRRGKDIHIVERRINYVGTELGNLILTVDFAPILSDTRKRHWELMSVMLVTIIIFTAMAVFVVDRLVRRPVNLLARASQRLAAGDFDVPLVKAGDDEVGILVDSFEDMRKAIREYRSTRKRAEEQLAKLNEELEQRVRDRTALLQRKTEELEEANERLKEVDRLKSAFLASMSHELRTPLNSVIGFSSVLLNEWVGPVNAEQRQNLASILRSGRHLLNMINDVLDVTKIESGTTIPVIEEFELHDLLAEAENEVAAAIRENGLELRSELLHQRMRTDRRRLLQCVLNILNNAVKFTDRGSVTVAARLVSSPGETPGAEMVEIAVTDTGIGICEEDQARIFQPFHRIVTPKRAIVPGTGLGLFLTRKIATEILKGDILVSSECGKGSRFTLRIPVRLP